MNEAYDDNRASANLMVRTPFLAALNEWVRSIIAGTIIGGGLAVILTDVISRRIDVPNIITVVVGLMSLVLGYYFGKTGTDVAIKDAAISLKERELIDDKANEVIDDLNDQVQKLKATLRQVMVWSLESDDQDLKQRIASIRKEDLGA